MVGTAGCSQASARVRKEHTVSHTVCGHVSARSWETPPQTGMYSSKCTPALTAFKIYLYKLTLCPVSWDLPGKTQGLQILGLVGRGLNLCSCLGEQAGNSRLTSGSSLPRKALDQL